MTAAINWDQSENFNKPPCKRTNFHLDSLIAAINSCGVSFKVWEKKNADGGQVAPTILLVSWALTTNLLKGLPQKLDSVVKADSSESVLNIWKVSY